MGETSDMSWAYKIMLITYSDVRPTIPYCVWLNYIPHSPTMQGESKVHTNGTIYHEPQINSVHLMFEE